MRRAALVALVWIVVTSLAVPASASRSSAVPSSLPACSSAPFTDVAADHPLCAEISWAESAGITTGYTDGSFRPAELVARHAVAAFLWRIDGSPAPSPSGQHFADVGPTHPFFSAIEWMGESGLSTGSPNPAGGLPLFKPEDSITREAMAAFLWRFAGSPASSSQLFVDVGPAHPFFSAIQWMGESGLSTGSPNLFGGGPKFLPSDPITRQAAVAFLARYETMGALKIPGPPTGVSAMGGNGSVVVSWNAPASNGGSPITSYVVSVSPGGSSCTWTAGPLSCTVTGLTNGKKYEFVVRAHNGVGVGPAWTVLATAGNPAFRLFYVYPAGTTQSATLPTAIISQMNAVRTWFGGQLGGLAPRVNSAGGVPTLTSTVLPWTQEQLLALTNPQANIETHLNSTYGSTGQRMVIWLMGSVNKEYCGVWNGTSVFVPMENCWIYPVEGSVFPYDGTYLLAHELTHALGAVPACAPHYASGHVKDDPRDILYSGPLGRDWDNLMLDPGRDDYYPIGGSGTCPSIANSPHLGPLALP